MKPEMSDDYDDDQDDGVDAPEIDDSITPDVSAEDGEAKDSEAERLKADEIAEAESLTVTAKQSQRQQLEDELARFLAQGGRIVEVPPDESVQH
jgi:hypothetical protein